MFKFTPVSGKENIVIAQIYSVINRLKLFYSYFNAKRQSCKINNL